MPEPNPIQQTDLPAIDTTTFSYLGHPGRWKQVIEVTGSSTVDFTGSNYGAGAIILTHNNCNIHFTGGGMISGSSLSLNTIYEFSISKVANESPSTQYVLIRNGSIR